MKLRFILFFSILVLLNGCFQQTNNKLNNGTAWAVGSFDSNGKRIYFSATSERGTPITYTDGPMMGMMMGGGNLSCASCHGVDAKGGKHVMQMEVMDAPDIRWSALSSDHHEMGKTVNKTMPDSKAYDFEDFRNALEFGKHPDGDILSKDMPRWKMTDEDLKDLMTYLKSLQ